MNVALCLASAAVGSLLMTIWRQVRGREGDIGITIGLLFIALAIAALAAS